MHSSWLPLEPLQHCIAHTGCKLLLLDAERADRLEPVTGALTNAHAVLVFNSTEGKGNWRGMESLDLVLHHFRGAEILESSPNIMPEDNATIMFTSGKLFCPTGINRELKLRRHDRITKGRSEFPAPILNKYPQCNPFPFFFLSIRFH